MDNSTISEPGSPPPFATQPQKKRKRKVLLMGRSGSGKSSMKSIIFNGRSAKGTRQLGATIDIDLNHVKFLGNLTLSLWDCAGQDSFVHKFLMPDERQKVFSDVGVLIYVFDITHRDSSGSSEGPGEYLTYGKILSELQQFSPTVKVYVLIHKMDLVIPILREEKYNAKALQVQKASKSFDPTIFASSIWDQSLYKAWAEIIHDLVPNLGEIEKHLSALGTLIEAEEVLLFERTSFLVVSSWASSIGEMNPTKDRFERLSNIIKNFKQTISGFTGAHPATEQFDFWDLKMSVYSLFVIKFTTNTYLAVVLPPGEARFNAAVENVKIASTEFEHLDTPVRKKLHRGPASNGMEQ